MQTRLIIFFIFIAMAFTGVYFYSSQPVCGWEGCDEPGHAFPDEERTMHFKRCMESMTKEYETKMKEESAESIKASLAEQKSVCDCIILSLEDRYSYVDWINIQASPGPEFFESIKEIAAECV